MGLSTTANNLAFISPVSAAVFEIPDRVQVRDVSASQILFHVKGNVHQAMSPVFDTMPAAIGHVSIKGERLIARLRPSILLVLTSRADAPTLSVDLRSFAGGAEQLLTVTDITHGRAVLRLSGLRASNVLSKLCGLDFRDSVFPDLNAAQTSYAKVKAQLIRRDTSDHPDYILIVDRSHAQYVWKVTVNAMQEFATPVE